MRVKDVVVTFITRRVFPLQRRKHKICHMSGRFDPTRISTKELSKLVGAYRINAITESTLTQEWAWGKQAYTRDNCPQQVRSPASRLCRSLLRLLSC